MKSYFIAHEHGCGGEVVEADSPEQAILIRRSQLSDREANYQMTADLIEDLDTLVDIVN